MSDTPQTDSISGFLLDFGAAIGWGSSYVLVLGGMMLIGHKVRNLFFGALTALEHSYLYLPSSAWGQTALAIFVAIVLIGIGAVLHPPCARRIIDRKLMQINDTFIWY